MIGYLIFLVILTATFALFSLGLNLQWGFTGLINFGHVAFMTVGAYTTVLLTLQGVPLVIAMLIGAAASSFLGFLIGLSTLRLREDYLAIVTIGVSELTRLFVNNQELPIGKEWRAGAFGIQGYPLPLENFNPNLLGKLGMIGLLTLIIGIFLWQLWQWRQRGERTPGVSQNLESKGRNNVDFWMRNLGFAVVLVLCLTIYGAGVVALYGYEYPPNRRASLMVLALLVLLVVLWQVERLVNSPWGRVLKAIREDEQVPKALGKNVFWYKLQAFMLGGAIAGLAGSFYAWYLTTVYPSNFEPLVTFNAWTVVVLGGAGNNMGTLLGAVLFSAYYEITRFVLPGLIPLDDARLGALRVMIIGLILMVLMIRRPQGILGKKEELTLGR